MKPEKFEHEPLERVFRAFEGQIDSMSDDEVAAELSARGLDPAPVTDAVSETVSAFLKRSRLSWKEEAKAKQSVFSESAKKLVSWGTKTKEEIEAAFSQVQQGCFGADAQGKVQTAFSNLKDVSVSDKASMLDDLELLSVAEEKQENEGGSE